MRKNSFQFLNEDLPEELKNFFYALGGTPFFLFFLQVLTGIFLLIYYVPYYDSAYESVGRITYTVSMGWWIRGLHKYGATIFIFSIFLHLIRTFVTRAYSSPREFTWITGGIMLFLSLGAGFTGYSLIHDQLSYWATRVGTELVESAPLIGRFLSMLIKGGERISQFTTLRLFTLHIYILPLLLAIFIFTHILLVRKYGVSIQSEKKYLLIPEHLYLEVNIFIFIFTALTLISLMFPPEIGERANPFRTPSHIKPEWYFYPVYFFLKLVPLKAGIIMLTAFIFLFLFYPYVEKLAEKVAGKYAPFALRTAGFLLTLYFVFAIIKESLD